MHVITESAELAAFNGCAFVPTMGALHEGHLSLIRKAKQYDKPVLVSIFVNPEQFTPDEDFQKYPRNLDQDVSMAIEAGADMVFAPEVGTIYPPCAKHQDVTLPCAATEPKLEDACRPTHFRGVCMVVARLFDLVQPSIAVFGEKDYQQYIVVQQLVANEGHRWGDLKIIGTPIIRDDDGLAISSRNVYLTPDQRSQALGLHEAVACLAESNMNEILEAHGLDVEYAVIRDEATLLDPVPHSPTRALVAARVGDIRLIDNAQVQP